MSKEETSTKPVGRPLKRDTSYVKLYNYVDDRDVEGWIRSAEECVRLLAIKGKILYHI